MLFWNQVQGLARPDEGFVRLAAPRSPPRLASQRPCTGRSSRSGGGGPIGASPATSKSVSLAGGQRARSSWTRRRRRDVWRWRPSCELVGAVAARRPAAVRLCCGAGAVGAVGPAAQRPRPRGNGNLPCFPERRDRSAKVAAAAPRGSFLSASRFHSARPARALAVGRELTLPRRADIVGARGTHTHAWGSLAHPASQPASQPARSAKNDVYSDRAKDIHERPSHCSHSISLRESYHLSPNCPLAKRTTIIIFTLAITS